MIAARVTPPPQGEIFASCGPRQGAGVYHARVCPKTCWVPWSREYSGSISRILSDEIYREINGSAIGTRCVEKRSSWYNNDETKSHSREHTLQGFGIHAPREQGRGGGGSQDRVPWRTVGKQLDPELSSLTLENFRSPVLSVVEARGFRPCEAYPVTCLPCHGALTHQSPSPPARAHRTIVPLHLALLLPGCGKRD